MEKTMEQRVQEFSKYGKKFIYIDFSHLKTNAGFKQVIDMATPLFTKHKKQTACSIVDVHDVRFDTETKEMIAAWMIANTPFVKYCIVIGMDGIKKIMLKSIMTMSGRQNVGIAANKEQAIEKLKQREWKKWEEWEGSSRGRA